METIGIIAEYNPFHNGHARQLALLRERFGTRAGIVIAQSGYFCQRGEPALANPWLRADAALAAGADLVLEIPAWFASATAETFAQGGVGVLAASGVIRKLAFGCETCDLTVLNQLADILTAEAPDFKTALSQALKAGQPFAAARQAAVLAVIDNPALADWLTQPNAILAIEYLKAIRRLPGCRLQPLPLPRTGAGEHNHDLPADAQYPAYASASAIRSRIEQSRTDRPPADKALSAAAASGPTSAERTRFAPDALIPALAPFMPADSLARLCEAFAAGQGPVLLSDFNQALQVLLCTRPVNELETLRDLQGGLAARLVQAARAAKDPACFVRHLIREAGTHAFPDSRIRRALISILLNLPQPAAGQASMPPAYARVLAANRQGRYILRLARRRSSIPLLTKASDWNECRGQNAQLQAEIDRRAAACWAAAIGQGPGADFDRVLNLN